MAKSRKQTFFNNTWVEESLIGEGSYGKVYKAKNLKKPSEICAIKNIRVEKSKQEIETLKYEVLSIDEIKDEIKEVLNSCEAEIKLMHDLKGSNHVVNIEDYEVINDKSGFGFELNIRMELLQKVESYYLDKELTNKDILKLGLDISKALKDCNEINIIHRDIKPDNIFVNKFGDYKLGDFGIARNLEKTTSGLSQKGTFNYIAPEVYKGARYNKTVDIYSLGLVLYKYFNYNRLPFLPPYPEKITVSSREEAVIKRTDGEKIIPPSNATDEEAKIILKMLSYDSKERYTDIDKLISDFEKVLKHEERLLPKLENKDSKVNTNLSVSKTEIEKQKSKIEKTKFNKLLLIPIPIIIIIISIVSFIIYQNNNYVLVPNLINEESSIAINKLENKSLNYKVKYKLVEDSKIGRIVAQDFIKKRVKKKKTITLTVGISDDKVEVIDVFGMNIDEAKHKLEELGLTISISYENSDIIEKDKVISQMTEKGTMINKGSVVEILISKGKEEKQEEVKEEQKNIEKKNEVKQTTSPSPSATTNSNPSPEPIKETTHVTSISIQSIYIASSGSTLLTFKYYPEDADDYDDISNRQIIWSNPSPSYVTINGNVVTTSNTNYSVCHDPVTITARIDGTNLTATHKVYFERKNADYDVNGDGKVNADDGGTITSNYNNGNYMDPSKYDFNCDGVVDRLDSDYPIKHMR